MRIIKVVSIIIGVLVIASVCTYAYYGGFSTINIHIEKQGGETIVYENVVGNYSQAPEVTNKIYNSLLSNEKIETEKGIAIFYNSQDKTDEANLHSEAGRIIENADSATIAKLSEKYNVKTLPEGDFVVAEFPYKSTVSIMIGVLKVYPALIKYCKENGYKGGPMTEIYDGANKKITYRREALK